MSWKQVNLYCSVKEGYYLLTGRPSTLFSSWFMVVKCNQLNLNKALCFDTILCKTMNERQRMGEAAGWTCQMWSQTDKQWEERQVKCGRNVTDRWGRHVDPVPHATGRFQVSHPPPPFTRGCQASLKETRAVPLGKSYKSSQGSEESASAGQLVKTRLLCCLVLVWGQLREAWPERGPHGHKLPELNLNITSVKTWPKYCVCGADFSILSPDIRWHLSFFTLLHLHYF